MKCLKVYLWIVGSALVFLLSTVSCFSTVPNSVFGTENHWSAHKICVVTVFLWSYTVGCNSNSYRSSSTTESPQEGREESAEIKSHREHKSKRSSLKLKSKSHNVSNKNSSSTRWKSHHNKKSSRQGVAATELSHEERIIEDLREHLISKLGVMDPMMCLPKAFCGLSSAASTHPNSSSQLVKEYLRHMKAVILPPTTTPKPIPKHRVRVKTTSSPINYDDEEQDEVKGEENFQSDEKNKEENSQSDEKNEEENSQSDETQEDEEYDDNDNDDSDTDEDDLPTDSDEELLRSYIHDKAAVEQYMKDEPYDDQPNWWHKVPETQDNTPINFNSGAGTFNSIFPNRLTSMFTSILPSFRFETAGNKKQKGVFEGDPFFNSFRSIGGGRSLTNEIPSENQNGDNIITANYLNDALISDKRRKKILKQVKKLTTKIRRRKARKLRMKTLKRKGKSKTTPKPASLQQLLKKVLQNNKNSFPPKMVLTQRIIDEQNLHGLHNELAEIPNPISRLHTAVDIGKKLDDPRKCDILFSACPWKYNQILQIIEDSQATIKGSTSNSGGIVVRNEETKPVETTKKPPVKSYYLTKIKSNQNHIVKQNKNYNGKSKNNKKKHNKGTPLPLTPFTNVVRDKNSGTIINHRLPGGNHLEIKLVSSEVNNKKQKQKLEHPTTPKINPAILAPFQSTAALGVKTKKKNKNKQKIIQYQYPTYNYRVSFPEKNEHKSAIIEQFLAMTKKVSTSTERPKPRKPATTLTTTTKRPTKKKKKNTVTQNDINVLEDSSESMVIRIPKTKKGATSSNTQNHNPFFFNPYKYFQQPQPQPVYSNYPTVIPAPTNYYPQYPQQSHPPQYPHQSHPQYSPQPYPQYHPQPQPQYAQHPQYPQQPAPWYLFGRRNGKVKVRY